jgi:hypothetical protein
VTDEQVTRLVDAVREHGNQFGGNLVHLKRFMERLQNEQQQFLAEQRAASDAAQEKANQTARSSAIAARGAAIAAVVAAIAGVAQAYAALHPH